jgi:SPP1 gp7 family putative phage head morphogenesis protein
MMLAMERALIKRMEALLIKQGQISAEAFESDGKHGVDLSFRDHPQEVEALLVAHYGVVMETFGQRIISEVSKTQAILESKDQQSFFRRSLLEWIQKNSGAKIKKISETTREDIVEAIRQAEIEGLALSKIKKRIQEVARNKAGYRARRIAVTETHSAAVAAGDMAADSTGLDLEREWMAALDERTRPSHARLDGTRVGMTEHFEVDGIRILRPGDPNAPAAETINCRCSIIYVTREA